MGRSPTLSRTTNGVTSSLSRSDMFIELVSLWQSSQKDTKCVPLRIKPSFCHLVMLKFIVLGKKTKKKEKKNGFRASTQR